MAKKSERGSWLRSQCYACGHRLRFDSTGCPQCGEEFHGRAVKRYPEKCECDRCTMARDGAVMGLHRRALAGEGGSRG